MTDTPDNQAPQQEPILAPEEIDALMQAVAPSEQAHALLATLPDIEQPQEVEDFSFSEGSDDGPDRYPLLYNLTQRMAEDLKEQWSEVFKREVLLSSEEIEERIYKDIIKDNDDNPQVYFIYEVQGFGRMMVTCELTLIIAYIEAMLGGVADVVDADHADLTAVEERLAMRIGTALEKLLSDMWKPVSDMDYALSKVETEAQFLAVATSQEACFSVKFEIKLSDEFRGSMNLHYPRKFLEPILDHLRTASSEEVSSVDVEWDAALQKSLEQVPLTVRLELGQCSLNIKQFLALRSGDFLPLSKSENDPSTLWVSSSPMFKAMPGSQDGLLAAELTTQLSQDN